MFYQRHIISIILRYAASWLRGFLSISSDLPSVFKFPTAKEQWRTLMEMESSQAN